MFGSSFSRSFRAGERPASSGISEGQITATASIWYDAATPSYFQPTNPINGDQITQWNDRSSAAHNAGPTGGSNKPTFATPALNGFGAVNFTGSQNLQVTNASWAAGQGAFAIFIVAKLSTNTSGIRTLIKSDQNGYQIQLNNGLWTVAAAGGVGTTGSPIADTNYHIFTLLFEGGSTGNAARLRFRCDTVELVLDYGITTVGSTTSASTSKVNFGWDGSSNYWLGQIAEVMIFTSTQSTTAVDAVEKYLKNKWNL